MKRYFWLFLPLAAGILLLLFGTRLTGISEGLREWFADTGAIPVRVAQVRSGRIVSVARASGELQPAKAMDISSPLEGVIGEVRFKAGESVKEGQIVATLRADELRQRSEKSEAALKLAEAGLRKREGRLIEAEKHLEKTREFRSRDLIAAKDLTDAEAGAVTASAERDLAQAQVAQIQATRAQLRHLLALANLLAPFNGVVTRRWVEPGAEVQSAAPILTIADLDTLKVAVKISKENLPSMRQGQSAQIRLEDSSGRSFEGRVSSLRIASSPVDHGAVAEIHLSNRERQLSAGITVTVALQIEEKRGALLVPNGAVFEVAGKNYVYGVAGRRAWQKIVTTGGHDGEMIEITNGVSEGEWIVAEPWSIKPDRNLGMVKDNRDR